jgi:hypothetical protein
MVFGSDRDKNRARFVIAIALLALLLPASGTRGTQAGAVSLPQPEAAPHVSLRATSGALVAFQAQDGETRDVPQLVLTRNERLTDSAERTLSVELSGIQVPPTGATLVLTVETQHADPDRDASQRIPVWRESWSIANSTGITQTGVTASLTHTFEADLNAGPGAIAAPTDYFRVRVVVFDAGQAGDAPLYAFEQNQAFLMERQWIEPLPEVAEESEGAAPDELLVHYCDMTPFRRDAHDPTTWVPREEVPDYVRTALVPAMVEAFRVQTDEWGFPWYQAWTGYRPEDGMARLSVALSDGETWFHGPAPSKGNAGISINVNGGRVEYATLTEGLMSTFHHELFHNHQRNLAQHSGGNGDVNGVGGAWDVFAEGTAVLASAVGQPEVELARTWGSRAYLFHATGFLGREGVVRGDLNTSYESLNAYHAAVYWRFLYEQCGGVTGGAENPAAGMAIIRRVLETLYAGEVVDILSSAELIEAMPRVMDRTLDGSACPFQTYADSLLAFAGAVYGLRLGDGFHDPHGLYPVPPAETLTYRGGEVVYEADLGDPAGIPSSFGIDLVEVVVDPSVQGRALAVELHGEPGAAARFRVQLWTLLDAEDGFEPAWMGDPMMFENVGTDGHLIYTLPAIDTAAYNRLGLVIVRVDADEATDAVGAYSLVLHEAATD